MRQGVVTPESIRNALKLAEAKTHQLDASRLKHLHDNLFVLGGQGPAALNTKLLVQEDSSGGPASSSINSSINSNSSSQGPKNESGNDSIVFMNIGSALVSVIGQKLFPRKPPLSGMYNVRISNIP